MSRYFKIHQKKCRHQTIPYRTSSSQHHRMLFLFILRSLFLPSPIKTVERKSSPLHFSSSSLSKFCAQILFTARINCLLASDQNATLGHFQAPE